MRGYNESDKPEGVHNYSMDKLTDDIKELIPALGKLQQWYVGDGKGIIWTHPENQRVAK